MRCDHIETCESHELSMNLLASEFETAQYKICTTNGLYYVDEVTTMDGIYKY